MEGLWGKRAMGEKADPSNTGPIGQLTWALCVMPASTISEVTPNTGIFTKPYLIKTVP